MTDVTIDPDIEQRIIKKVEQTKFNSVEEYVNFVLREVVETEQPNKSTTGPDRDSALQDQLEDLGYL